MAMALVVSLEEVVNAFEHQNQEGLGGSEQEKT